jgi:hypothetical protein
MRITLLMLIAFMMLDLINCSTAQAPAGRVTYAVPKSPVDLVKQYYRDVAWRLPERPFEYAYIYDSANFLLKHRDEMLQTLNVAETVEVETLGVCFVRYSVGGNVYRDARWIRKIDGDWFICAREYFSSYADDPFGDGNPQHAKKLIERVDAWNKDSSPKWW